MKHDHRGVRRIAIALVAGSLATGALAGCSSKNQVPSIGYGVDAVIASYNGSSTLGANSGAAAVFSRVLTGFFYTGPDGQPVADTDVGTAKEVPGDAQTIQYRLNPEGTYSDGIQTSCDDLVLTWAARSGRFTKAGPGGPVPLFDAASTDGYRDIERVDCQPGSKDATVVFRPGKHYSSWKALFNASEMMPAHVVASQVKIPNVVTPVQTGDQPTLERIADFWNNGWKLTPGKLDLTLLPSSGPYRVDSFSDKDGLVLVKNEKWWGNQPKTPRIVVWDRHSDLKSKVSDNSVGVLDVGAGSLGEVGLGGFHKQNLPGRGVEQLVLGGTGVFGLPDARKAFALCVPRQALFDKFGHPEYDVKLGLGAGVLNSRTVQQDSLYYPAIAGAGDKYKGGDATASQAAASSGIGNQTVRIGYVKPDERRAAMVSAIADACKSAGITVVDAGAPDFTASQLTDGKVDAILGGTAGMPGPSGTLAATDAIAALRTGAGLNYGRWGNGRYDAIADQLAAEDNSTTVLNLLTEQENLLWGEMPSIPLFASPRTIAFGDGMENGIASPTRAGAGWNMDRWVLKR
ncbi:ABC transporter substrate-binding protein [Nocardia sp. CDC160]|uniref:ABC transporter substrate-binding protein n=1 Tax=Nocardia sp. CDC160 TaxID=3112166 RepID=UPI002DBB7366|nr:ABC transporter substrate-binding protein [Nocardia sp. CDC160]MEC3918244.1 ABC transporter substrate-binding protein [Nocardia sp. CDC160]